MSERIKQLADQIKDIKESQDTDEIMKRIVIYKLVQEARLTAQGHILLEELLKKSKDQEEHE